MGQVFFRDLDKYGIIKDLPRNTLPIGAWSAGQNIRFYNGAVEKISGQLSVLTPSVVPYQLFFVAPNLWVYLGTAKAYVTDGSTHFNITRQTTGVDVDYAMDQTIGWNGGAFNGIRIFNNGVDVPQMWVPISTSQRLQNLSAWPGTLRANVVRPFKDTLVALGITKSGTSYPVRVKWSHPADPGTVPSSWDETDVTKDAGEYDLSETSGETVDCLQLDNTNVIYKSDSIWTMQYIGGLFIFDFKKKFDVGILSRRCVREIEKKHLVLSNDDLIIHNLQSINSVLDKKNRKALFSQIDTTNYARSFISLNPLFNEAWVCFPAQGASRCTQALVWNWKDGACSFRDLPNIASMEYGARVTGTTNLAWSAQAQAWSDALTQWGFGAGSAFTRDVLMASPTDNKIYQVGSDENFNGANYASYVERVGLGVEGMDRFGNPYVNENSVKLLSELYPHIEADPGTSIDIYVGSQMTPNDAVSYTGPLTFTPGVDLKVNPLVTGRLFSFKFQSNSSAKKWKLTGFDIQVKKIANY